MTDVVCVCSASTVMTAKGSGSLNTSRLKRPSAATTVYSFSESALACYVWWRHSTCYSNPSRAETEISSCPSCLQALYLQISIACGHVDLKRAIWSGSRLSSSQRSHPLGIRSQMSTTCPNCGSSNIVFDVDAGQLVCTSCGTADITPILVPDTHPRQGEHVFRTPHIPHNLPDVTYTGTQNMVKGAEWHIQNHLVSNYSD